MQTEFPSNGHDFWGKPMKIIDLEGETGFPRGSIPVDGLRRLGVNKRHEVPYADWKKTRPKGQGDRIEG